MAHPSAYQAVITFGKYKGSSWGYVRDKDPDYLQWLISTNLNAVTVIAARKCLLDESLEGLPLPRVHRPTFQIQSTQPVGIILKNDNTAAVKFPYHPEIVNRIKTEVDGRKWDANSQAWLFPAVQLPKVVSIFGGEQNVKMSPEAHKKLLEELSRRQELDDIRKKEDTALDIPGLLLPLYPFQKVAVEFVNRAGGRAMIADACGLGKTVDAIAYAQLHQLKTLVVCPKSVTIQWREEVLKWTGKTATLWDSQRMQGDETAQIHIINYDAVPKQLKHLLKINWDLLVCDEATYLKNRKTLRAKAVLGSWRDRAHYPGIKTKHLLFLTATPILNRPIEAYYLLNAIDPQRFNSFYHFTQRYGGWKFGEPRNLDELHERTKDVVIRRRKSQVYNELPDKQRNDLFIQLDKNESQQYKDLLKDLFDTWRFTGKATVSTMPKIQGFLSNKKLDRAKELIDELLEEADRSVLVFSVYIDPLRALKSHYGNKAELLYGDTPALERRKIVERLATGKSRIGCIGLHAGGMGLDGLQESVDTVIFLNMDWIPAVHEQAEDRTHRIGQKKKVQVYYLVCEDTIDEDMREILTEKQKIIDTVTDGKLLTVARDRSYFNEFVRRISMRYNVPEKWQILES